MRHCVHWVSEILLNRSRKRRPLLRKIIPTCGATRVKIPTERYRGRRCRRKSASRTGSPRGEIDKCIRADPRRSRQKEADFSPARRTKPRPRRCNAASWFRPKALSPGAVFIEDQSTAFMGRTCSFRFVPINRALGFHLPGGSISTLWPHSNFYPAQIGRFTPRAGEFGTSRPCAANGSVPES
jgi:hypothetical protein